MNIRFWKLLKLLKPLTVRVRSFIICSPEIEFEREHSVGDQSECLQWCHHGPFTPHTEPIPPSLLVSCPHHYSGVRREGSGPWESPFMRILIIQPCWSVWEISPQTTDKLTSFSWKCHANRENLSEKKSCQKDIWVYLETQPFFVLPNESQQEHHWIVYWSAVTVNISFCDRLQILNITKQSRGVELLINC